MSSYTVKVCTRAGYRRNSAVFIVIIALLSCFGLGMMIYNFIKGNILFAISYMIAVILGLTYVFIRISTVFATYAAVDRKHLYMKNWSNDFLPYAADLKVKILSEFVPAKTKMIEIPIEDISDVLIGTKNFIKRYIDDDDEFIYAIKPYETTKDFYRKKTIHNMDILYVNTYDSGSYFMPVANFDPKNMTQLIKTLERRNPDIVIKVNSREFRKIKNA